jgi:Uma2 family endonuclease
VLTPEEYLDIERRAEFRSEYYQGQMHAMSGTSRIHNIVALNIAAELRASLRGRPCRAYAADLRVQVSATGLYT